MDLTLDLGYHKTCSIQSAEVDRQICAHQVFPSVQPTITSRDVDVKIVMAREIFGPDYLPYRQEKQM